MPRPAVVKAVADEPGPGQEPVRRIVTVDYEGHAYTVDMDAITIDALEDFENQKYIRALRAILDAEQWAIYKSRHPRAVDLDRFITALLAAATGPGSLGNSPASSAS